MPAIKDRTCTFFFFNFADTSSLNGVWQNRKVLELNSAGEMANDLGGTEIAHKKRTINGRKPMKVEKKGS